MKKMSEYWTDFEKFIKTRSDRMNARLEERRIEYHNEQLRRAEEDIVYRDGVKDGIADMACQIVATMVRNNYPDEKIKILIFDSEAPIDSFEVEEIIKAEKERICMQKRDQALQKQVQNKKVNSKSNSNKQK